MYVHLCVFACAIEMFMYVCDAEISKHFNSGKMVRRLLKRYGDDRCRNRCSCTVTG